MSDVKKKINKIYKAEIKGIDPENYTVTTMVSNDSVDRDGEIVTPKAIGKRLDIYRAHPVLLSSHRHDDLMKQIGMAEDIKATPKGVTAKFKYFVGQGNPEADWAFKLAQNGIAAYSIGFMAHGWEDKQVDGQIYREFTDVELIEISQVLVPSNRDALATRRDSKCEIEKELVELAISKCFGDSDPKPAEVVPAPAAPEPAKPAAPVETPSDLPTAPIVEIPAPSAEVTTDLAKQLLSDEAFIAKLAEKLSTKQTPKAEENEGYFKGLLDPADGSPKAESKEQTDISALFSESTARHFKKKE